MKNKKLILTAAASCSALILASSIAPAFAYFSTYERALGGYTIHLDDYIENWEEFDNWVKHVKIKNQTKSSEYVYVRVKAFAGVDLQYSAGPEWTPGAEDYYYYEKILAPGEETTQIDVKITSFPKGIDPESFNVVVVYECTPVRYDEAGNPKPADWSEEFQVIREEVGGDN